ncbi:MAG TPA: type II toxin-antitoxin system prevent-host-death family antitoxin [Bryobacteraceae bacterium]
MGTIGAFEAKTHLAALLDRVAKGEKITITRHGVPAAMLVLVRETSLGLSHKEIVDGFRALRRRVKAGGKSVREMIQEGAALLTGAVVDASVALAWCFPDEASDYAEAVLVALEGKTIMVPAIWGLEIANAVLASERQKRLRAQEIQQFVALLENIRSLWTCDPCVNT